MEFTKGNILRAETEAIVNPVNRVGFMGRGIAAQFKRSYPENRRPEGKDKPYFGEQVAVRTGLATLRAKCPRFGAWVGKLEALGGEKS